MSVSGVTLTVYITGFNFKLSEIKTLLFFKSLKTVTFWHSGIEFWPGLQSLHSFDPPVFISVLWYFIFSLLYSDLHSFSTRSLLCFIFSDFLRFRAIVLVWCCAAFFLLWDPSWSLPTEALSTHKWIPKKKQQQKHDFLLYKEKPRTH